MTEKDLIRETLQQVAGQLGKIVSEELDKRNFAVGGVISDLPLVKILTNTERIFPNTATITSADVDQMFAPNGQLMKSLETSGLIQKKENFYVMTEDAMPTTFIPYEDMVRNLFKVDPSNVVMAMHAAIGIAGEVAEIRESFLRPNLIKELGDIYFYIVAMKQRFTSRPGGDTNGPQVKEVTESPYNSPTFGSVLNNLTVIAGTILDLTKKSWVYQKDLNEYALWANLELLQINLDYIVTQIMGITWETIRFENQMKLIGTKEQKGRYASGTYSNEQAINRADETK